MSNKKKEEWLAEYCNHDNQCPEHRRWSQDATGVITYGRNGDVHSLCYTCRHFMGFDVPAQAEARKQREQDRKSEGGLY